MMQKRLRFLFRYLFASHRWSRWLSAQSMLVVVISTAFLSTLYMTAPFSTYEKADRSEQELLAGAAASLQTDAYPYPAPVTETPQLNGPTPLPAEYYLNTDQSIGITLAATILVMIVVFGALMYMPRHGDE